MSSITPTCQEAFMINLSRVTSLQNRPSTCWKEKKNLMLIRYLLSAGNRCLSPSSCFAELQGLHAFSWQRLYETRGHLAQNKVFGSFGLSPEVTVKDGLGWTNRVWFKGSGLFIILGFFFTREEKDNQLGLAQAFTLLHKSSSGIL